MVECVTTRCSRTTPPRLLRPSPPPFSSTSTPSLLPGLLLCIHASIHSLVSNACMHLFIHPSILQYINPSIHLFLMHAPSIHPSTHSSIHFPIQLHFFISFHHITASPLPFLLSASLPPLFLLSASPPPFPPFSIPQFSSFHLLIFHHFSP